MFGKAGPAASWMSSPDTSSCSLSFSHPGSSAVPETHRHVSAFRFLCFLFLLFSFGPS